ncbi:MAG: transcriptional repressor [Clostridia bacterium]|nr:transcriptional repressor [Clostridia bacterium]
MSKQREAILAAVRKSCSHPDADTICATVRADIPNISLGTVYRNLGKLADEGIIRRISVPSGADRFDKTICPHGHIVCPVCGGVSDLSQEVTQALEQALGDCRSYELTVSRECQECKKL